MACKVMISTLHSYEPVIAGAISVGINRLILLKDPTPVEELDHAENEIKSTLGEYVQIETIKTPTYDIYQVSADVVSLIDSFDKETEIYLNISAGRKTKSLGLMFAGYARSEKIKQIIYVTKEEKEIIVLPNMPFDITDKQKKVLSQFVEPTPKTLKEIYRSAKISRATLFLMIKEFKRKGLLEESNKISIAGKIALL